MFHNFHIFCHKQQKYEAPGLLGPGCALTNVNIYKSYIYIYNTVENILLSDIIANNDVKLYTNEIGVSGIINRKIYIH